MILINDCTYGKALDMMPRQKVEMNLIVDMNPPKYLNEGGIREMLQQVEKMYHLNLFIAGLSNCDITEWKYKVPSWLQGDDGIQLQLDSNKRTFDFTTKFNQVCQKMLAAMIRRIPYKGEISFANFINLCQRGSSTT